MQCTIKLFTELSTRCSLNFVISDVLLRNIIFEGGTDLAHATSNVFYYIYIYIYTISILIGILLCDCNVQFCSCLPELYNYYNLAFGVAHLLSPG